MWYASINDQNQATLELAILSFWPFFVSISELQK